MMLQVIPAAVSLRSIGTKDCPINVRDINWKQKVCTK